MSIASRLKWYLEANEVPYEIVRHRHSRSSRESARRARLPAGRVAKCVLLEDERGYVLAVLPASCHLDFRAIGRLLQRDLELASEVELAGIFGDCEVGAVPVAGRAYNVPMVVDASLMRLPDLYFEAGDHEALVHVGREAFGELVAQAVLGHIGAPD